MNAFDPDVFIERYALSLDDIDVDNLAELPEYCIWEVCFRSRIPSGVIPLQVSGKQYDLDVEKCYEFTGRLLAVESEDGTNILLFKMLTDIVLFGVSDFQVLN